MALKRHLYEHERFGLTDEEIRIAEKYLRQNKTKGAISDIEAMKLYELMMLGYSFVEIQQQYKQYPLPQIILTAALKGWMHDREKMTSSLRDRVQAKVIKSVLEQVDFLTSMLSVASVEHLDEMRSYMLDPKNNPKPSLRISSLKDYKEVADSLQKVVAGATGSSHPNKKNSPMFEALAPSNAKRQLPAKQEKLESDSVLDAIMED